jgi:hypothetical protein
MINVLDDKRTGAHQSHQGAYPMKGVFGAMAKPAFINEPEKRKSIWGAWDELHMAVRFLVKMKSKSG